MMHIRKASLEVELQVGSFHSVRGVGIAQTGVSILVEDSYELIIPVQSAWDDFNKCPQTIEIDGTFGDFHNVKGGDYIHGIEVKDLVSVDVVLLDTNPQPDWNFHRRQLQLVTAPGAVLCWTLFVEGHPDDYN